MNANFRPGYSVFLMLRKEARAAYARYLASKAALRRVERKLGKLDAIGAGRGLPRRDVFQYNSYVREARLLSEQLETLCEILGRYGQRLEDEMRALSSRTPILTKLSLIGASSSLVSQYEGTSPELCDLVLRDRLEDTSGELSEVPFWLVCWRRAVSFWRSAVFLARHSRCITSSTSKECLVA
ncbi:TPA: hypothetical protein ACXLB5_004911 [Pseudomonas aeruginosa]